MIQSKILYIVTKYVSCVGQLSLRGPGRHVIKVCMLFLLLSVSCDDYLFFEGKKIKRYDTSCMSSKGVHNIWLPFCEEIKN
jgi:hypothetical protein